MSSADSGVNAMASVVAVDLYPSFSKNVTEKKGLRLGKITAALIMVWGVVLAPHYQKLGPIYPFILKLGGFLLMPIGVCFIFGRFSRRVNHQGAIACLVFGVALGLTYVLTTGIPAFASRLPGWVTVLHFYELLPVFFVLLGAILFGVSWMFPAPGAVHLAVLDAKDPSGVSGAEGRPVWQSFQLWFAAFLAVLGLMYVVY
jgi:solute:Na+ symporter, SSS family